VNQDRSDLSASHTNDHLLALVGELEAALPDLKRERLSSATANDIYEVADDWRSAANFILNRDTRVDFQARAFSESHLLNTLKAVLEAKPIEAQRAYSNILRLGEEIVQALQTTTSPKDGHLGVLRILRERFLFLEEEFGFVITNEKPVGLRWSSGQVFLELEFAHTIHMTCAFGSENEPNNLFWLDDLVYLFGKEPYKFAPPKLTPNTTEELEVWFNHVANVFQMHGRPVLSNETGIFARLAEAQSKRDKEIDEYCRS
jgi:hypothetical protein